MEKLNQVLKQLLLFYERELYDDAEKLSISIIDNFPENYFAWKVLGASLAKKKKFVEALRANQKAVTINPKDPQSHYNLAITLKEIGNFEESIKSYKEAIKIKPEYAEAYSNLGNLLKALGRVEEAESNYRKALIFKSDFAQPHYNLGLVLQELNKIKEAKECYIKAIKIKPDYAEAHNNLGIIFQGLGKLDESETKYREAIQINPDLSEAYSNLCDLLERANKIDKGLFLINTAKKILKAMPHDLLLYEAIFLFRKKNIKQTQSLIEKINIKNLTIKRKPIFYNLKGNLLQYQGSFDEAFDEFKSMNNHIKTTNEYNNNKPQKYFNFIKKRANELKNTKTNWLANNNPSNEYKKVKFLVGFPRSGTTLIDTILRTHSKINVFEEKPMLEKAIKFIGHQKKIIEIENINYEVVNKARAIYFEELKKHIDEKKETELIDKLPLNILHLPIINLIFPKTKYIFVVRHPYDSILSCWMQNFKINPAMANMCDLDRVVDFFCISMEIYELSRKRYNLNINIVRYEDLIEDFKGQISKLLRFLDLEWENNLINYQKTASERNSIDTPSYSQVIKPIYKTSTNRWKHYEKYFDKYRKKIEKWSIKFGYDL